MKIVSLIAENVKRLVAVEIKPDGNLVEITGRNGQGKTSVLDSIMWAIEGARHIQAEPIRKGADSARIRLDLGEIIVQRNFYRDEGRPTSLTVMAADGQPFRSPQGMLDALLGALSFDPLAFARMKPKDQFDALRKFVPGVNFAQITLDNKDDEERRTSVGRLRDQAKGAAATAAIGLPPDLPEEPVDEGTLATKLEEAGQANTMLARQRSDLETLRAEAHGAQQLAHTLANEAQQLRERADDLDQRSRVQADLVEQLLIKIDNIGEIPANEDTRAIVKQLADARATNMKIRQRDESRRHSLNWQKLDAEWKALSKKIADRNEAKRQAIAAAKMPVEGIGFGEDCILLNGLPFEQASDAEQLTASVSIAMATSPKLRVIRIRDGSLLDEKAMQLLGELADRNDMQVWVERVDSTGQIGFVIEDGHVRKGVPRQSASNAQMELGGTTGDPALDSKLAAVKRQWENE